MRPEIYADLVRGLGPLFFKVRWLDAVDSTNDLALECIRNGEIRTVELIGAEFQRHGKGRQGRFWHSSPAKNLLFSLVLETTAPCPEQLWQKSCCAGVALCICLNHYHIKANLIWPNDVYVGTAKIAGMLFESASWNKKTFLVAGVGLNVNQRLREFPESLRKRVTSMVLCGAGPQLDRFRVLRTFLRAFFKLESSPWPDIWRRYKQWSGVRGQCVLYKRRRYRAVDVLEDGGLALDSVSAGESIILKSGHIEFYESKKNK